MTKYRVDRMDHKISASTALRQPHN